MLKKYNDRKVMSKKIYRKKIIFENHVCKTLEL